MKSLTEHLTRYAAYHRDRRNVATHFVGIPMIAVSLATLFARPAFGAVAGFPASPALLGGILAAGFYLTLDVRYGAAMTALVALTLGAGAHLAAGSTGAWLGAGLGLFVAGWAIQFVGHAFEGRKPAFVDDVIGLLVGPLFLVAEVSFALGLRGELGAAVRRGVAAR
jgi:uncharacterized membrane protein YGL010W